MRININESGISFNRDSNNTIDKALLEEIEKRLENININDKVEYSDKIPTDEDIVIWINPEEDPAQEYLIRINDGTVASNTVWSSEKVYQQINSMFIQTNSHIHFNKDVLDKITEKDIIDWNSKSDFDGSYKSLTDKPAIPSIEGLASEEYVDEAIENLQLPSNLVTIEDIPTKVSELENDSNYISETELEDAINNIEKTINRINDETVASDTTWSSEKVNTLISSLKLIKEGNVVKLMLGDIELSNINI